MVDFFVQITDFDARFRAALHHFGVGTRVQDHRVAVGRVAQHAFPKQHVLFVHGQRRFVRAKFHQRRDGVGQLNLTPKRMDRDTRLGVARVVGDRLALAVQHQFGQRVLRRVPFGPLVPHRRPFLFKQVRDFFFGRS